MSNETYGVPGRYLTYRETVVNGAVFERVRACEANPARVAVGFSHIYGNPPYISTDSTAQNNVGMTINFPEMLWLYASIHGDLCRAELWLNGDATSPSLTVFEIIDTRR